MHVLPEVVVSCPGLPRDGIWFPAHREHDHRCQDSPKSIYEDQCTQTGAKVRAQHRFMSWKAGAVWRSMLLEHSVPEASVEQTCWRDLLKNVLVGRCKVAISFVHQYHQLSRYHHPIMSMIWVLMIMGFKEGDMNIFVQRARDCLRNQLKRCMSGYAALQKYSWGWEISSRFYL